ncbi:FkbM family methyltransferase [Frankia sp. B2]|nr:FkbM family methyltransferase [Frankia sp. B2]
MSGHRAGPLRWRLAGRLAAGLPSLRGRGWPTRWMQDPANTYSGPRYRPPALAPVFDAVLRPGDCCYDVAAGLGIYTLWAAGVVGAAGEVHAFEEAPRTGATLAALVERNRLSSVHLSSAAVGASATVGASAAVGVAPIPGATPITLDAHAARHRPPALVRIGGEAESLDVLRGAGELLRAHRPALLLAMPPRPARRGGDRSGENSHRGEGDRRAAGENPGELVSLLAAAGYRILNLSRRGLTGQGVFSPNVLALHDGWERFEQVAVTLRRTPLPRDRTA